MRLTFTAAAALTTMLLVSGMAVAQDRGLDLNIDHQASPSDQQTPSLLPVEQSSREDDAKQAVRRNAEFRADQRMRRLSVRQWTGNSAARPRVAATSLMAPNTSYWGGNRNAPFVWFMVR